MFQKKNPRKFLESVPSPGSEEAVDMGCSCPVMDNRYGRGGLVGYWISAECPIHGVNGLEAYNCANPALYETVGITLILLAFVFLITLAVVTT